MSNTLDSITAAINSNRKAMDAAARRAATATGVARDEALAECTRLADKQEDLYDAFLSA